MENKELLKYKLGTLMYCPANNETIADNILNKKWDLNTIVFDLEDAILPQVLQEATDILEGTLRKLKAHKGSTELPLMFIRVRDPEHLERVYARFYMFSDILTGFVLPKFDMTVAYQYMNIIHKINSTKNFYFLPILESPSVVKINRKHELQNIKRVLLEEASILGILVGSNDMCSYFGLRRNAHQTIYDVGVIRDVLVDIINVFRKDFVISGPIWEFFDGDNWEEGLRREFELDKLNGFIGKACIHPNQIPIIKECMKVDEYEYEDAVDLVNWTNKQGVLKSKHTGRMNEVTTNKSWGQITKILGDIYGIKKHES